MEVPNNIMYRSAQGGTSIMCLNLEVCYEDGDDLEVPGLESRWDMLHGRGLTSNGKK